MEIKNTVEMDVPLAPIEAETIRAATATLLAKLPYADNLLLCVLGKEQHDKAGRAFRTIVPMVPDAIDERDVAKMAAMILATAIGSAGKRSLGNGRLVWDKFEETLNAMMEAGGTDHFRE